MTPEAIKLLEENIGSHLFDMGLNIFLDMCPQARETKAKINCRDYTETKSFARPKETINKQGNLLSGRGYLQMMYPIGVIPKIYKELIQPNTQKSS